MTEFLDLVRVLVGPRFPFKFIYSKDYWMLDAGSHIFPIRKYRMLYERLLALGARARNFVTPQPAADEDLLLVHTAKYVRKLRLGTLSTAEVVALELPFSPEVVKFAVLTVGGTILAGRHALADGLAMHLGGGFHHAFPDHGEGFCVLNDVAVAIEVLRRDGLVRRAMVVDVDLHQGNGTAAIFSRREDVFTFSIHQMDIYPSVKPAGSLDIGLWSGDGDEKYLAEMRAHFPGLFREYRPDLVLYVAGADPYEKDQLGSLLLTKDGLRERDRIVIDGARRLGIPVLVVLAGGYAADVDDTVEIHLNTIREAARAQRRTSRFLSPRSTSAGRRPNPGRPEGR
ncbi:MAG: histone deacetylase [Candidatus Aminicenantes bacterium]|nr:histone deacetylase [Candidatus Aminicenantes bacterium]